MDSTIMTEKINREILNKLLVLGADISYEGEAINEDTLTKLKNYSKFSKNGKVKVLYKKAAYGLGRRFPNFDSLSKLWHVLRNTLTDNIYYDVDMVNAQPVILSQILKKNNLLCPLLEKYINERDDIFKNVSLVFGCSRDTVKQLFISMMNGGGIESWIKENKLSIDSLKENKENETIKYIIELKEELKENAKLIYFKDPFKMVNTLKHSRDKNRDPCNNPIYSHLSIMNGEIEDRILMYIKDGLEERGFNIGVLIFDGLMVEKDKELTEEIIKEIEEKILNDLSYDIKLKIKPMDKKINIDKLMEETGKKEIKDAEEAAEVFIKHHGTNKFKYCDKELYIFDDTTGMWSSDIVVIRKMALLYKKYLGDYSLKKLNDMLDNVMTKCEDPTWITNSEMSSVGYLLFNNGYYDMKECKFYDKSTCEYKPEIVFYKRINRDFTYHLEDQKEENEKNIKMVLENIFYNICGTKEEADYLILCLARSLYGPELKRVYFGIGAIGNNGKSILSSLLSRALDGYFHSFNAGNFVNKPGTTTDEAARLRWSYLIRHCRIIVSNEIRMSPNENMSGDELKKHSGGDTLEGRKHREEEKNYEFQYTPYIMSNDIPTITPYDDAINSRIRVFNFPYTFKMPVYQKQEDGTEIDITELKENERIADEDLKFKITQTDYKNGLLYLSFPLVTTVELAALV